MMPEAGEFRAEAAPLPGRWKALAVLALGVFMGTLDISIVNVALPTLTRAFHTNLATIQWVVVTYGLVVTSFMLSAGRLGDMVGKRKVYAWGLALFSLGSLLAGMSPTVGVMLAARAIQAAGAVMMQALMAAMVSDIFPPGEMGRALGLIGAAVSVGLAAGPALGGLLIAVASWHLIFLINVPIGVVGLFLLRRWVPELTPSGDTGSFDLFGSGLLLGGLCLYALGLTMIQARGMTGGWTAPVLAAAAVAVAVFVFWQRRSPHPMLDLTLFHERRLALGLAMGLLMFTALSASYMLPFYLQYGRGYSAGVVGLLMMSSPAAMAMSAPLAGWWADRMGERGALLSGLLLAAVGCWATSTLSPQSGPWDFLIRVSPIGFGIGLFQTPNIRAIMNRAPAHRRGVASGLSSLSRTLGTISGMPLLAAVFVHGLGPGLDPADQAVVTRATPAELSHALASVFHLSLLLIVVVMGLALWALSGQSRRTPRS